MPYTFFRLCSEYEECPQTIGQCDCKISTCIMKITAKSRIHYCSLRITLQKSIPRLFPGCKRTRICLNGTTYMAFQGTQRSVHMECSLRDPVIVMSRKEKEVSFAVPTVLSRNREPINVITSIDEEITLTLSTRSESEGVDLPLIDVSPQITVSRPEKALVQISKSLRLCRGVEDQTGSTSSKTWTSILDRKEECRLRSPACTSVVSWLSCSEVCASCRTNTKKQGKQRKAIQTCHSESVSCSPDDDMLLQNVLQKVSKGDNADSQAVLLLSQANNMNTGKDPRHRRWAPEVITLCLTLYCR